VSFEVVVSGESVGTQAFIFYLISSVFAWYFGLSAFFADVSFSSIA